MKKVYLIYIPRNLPNHRGMMAQKVVQTLHKFHFRILYLGLNLLPELANILFLNCQKYIYILKWYWFFATIFTYFVHYVVLSDLGLTCMMRKAALSWQKQHCRDTWNFLDQSKRYPKSPYWLFLPRCFPPSNLVVSFLLQNIQIESSHSLS